MFLLLVLYIYIYIYTWNVIFILEIYIEYLFVSRKQEICSQINLVMFFRMNRYFCNVISIECRKFKSEK